MPKPSAQKRTSKEERAWLRQRERAAKLAKRRDQRESKPEPTEGHDAQRMEPQSRPD